MEFVALVNPIAGRGNSVERWDRLALQLLSTGTDARTVVTQSRDHAVTEAARAAASGACVVAVGGDGMVRDVASGVVRSSGTMAIIPTGRGNDLAGKLGIPTSEIRLDEMLCERASRVIDVLDVNGHVVPGNAYAGVDSVAARMINRTRRVPPFALYRGAGLAATARWKKTEFALTIERDGELFTRSVHAHDIVVANSGRYGHGLHIVPDAQLDDGLLDVLIVHHGSPLRIISMLRAAERGDHVDRSDVEVFQTTSITIEADRPIPFGADGDEVTELPATIKVRPKALRVIVPRTPAMS